MKVVPDIVCHEVPQCLAVFLADGSYECIIWVRVLGRRRTACHEADKEHLART